VCSKLFTKGVAHLKLIYSEKKNELIVLVVALVAMNHKKITLQYTTREKNMDSYGYFFNPK